ncbi:glycosyltransferase [Luteibacter sp. UNCMF366Tsu5.1]|uniref:glycosyltransferase n=1 Tax=Luteibacter sp. UNCMF366Tsu5.1 TaxID=1502758 RepID=UPI000908DB90|nr:glycosyltransferase [Luteibacter sp. UNCMF366Tsu5.1]SFW73613.1 Glycosyltransferase involved in cell wall bisynthesis [Luteibacter sp. UNCMF366Tsu5.1]
MATVSPGRTMTVVQLIPALHAGGAERSTLEIAKALVQAGHRSIVVSAGGRLVAQLEAEGSRHVTLPIGRKSLATLFTVGKLRRLLREVQPDIVHARSRLPAWIGWWAMRGVKPRPHFFTTVHGLNSPGRYSAILMRGERVIVVSQTLRDYVLRHYPDDVDAARIAVVPRGVDTDAFPYGYRPDDTWQRAFFEQYPQLAGAPLLTLPGRGTRLKGHADAIELIADLAQRSIDARLLLLGADEPGREAYVAELRALIHRRGLDDKVVISPQRSDVRDVYAMSDIVLQLSNRPESFGRTVVEALALCRPVMGYAHGGVGELLAELYPAGRVPLGDREKLVERAAELLRFAPPIPPPRSYRLSDMQAATLALYAEVVEGVPAA